MDQQVLSEKLEALRRCVTRIEDRRKDTPESLSADVDAQDILSLNLTRAVQLCVDMAFHLLSDRNEPPPNTMGETFEALSAAGFITPALASRLRAVVGFRNIAVHSYQAIDWAIVHRSPGRLPPVCRNNYHAPDRLNTVVSAPAGHSGHPPLKFKGVLASRTPRRQEIQILEIVLMAFPVGGAFLPRSGHPETPSGQECPFHNNLT